MIKKNEGWQVRLFRKSIVKQLKFSMLRKYLGEYRNLKCLDLGSDNGVISYLLRLDGGQWCSADIDKHMIKMIRDIVHENVFLIEDSNLPFSDSAFDVVVIIDLLEHIEEDKYFMIEVSRVLKPGGKLIINVPYINNRSFTRWLRKVIGLTDEQHGHVRAGYTIKRLCQLAPSLNWECGETYSREFTEINDIIVSSFVSSKNKKPVTQKGIIFGKEDFTKQKVFFYLYSIIYPFMWLISKLDILLFFASGHKLIVRFHKR